MKMPKEKIDVRSCTNRLKSFRQSAKSSNGTNLPEQNRQIFHNLRKGGGS